MSIKAAIIKAHNAGTDSADLLSEIISIDGGQVTKEQLEAVPAFYGRVLPELVAAASEVGAERYKEDKANVKTTLAVDVAGKTVLSANYTAVRETRNPTNGEKMLSYGGVVPGVEHKGLDGKSGPLKGAIKASKEYAKTMFG